MSYRREKLVTDDNHLHVRYWYLKNYLMFLTSKLKSYLHAATGMRIVDLSIELHSIKNANLHTIEKVFMNQFSL